jgi:hypothetical protein
MSLKIEEPAAYTEDRIKFEKSLLLTFLLVLLAIFW